MYAVVGLLQLTKSFKKMSLFGCDNSAYLGKAVRHSSPVEGYVSDDVLSFRQGRIQRQRKASFSLQILTNHPPCKKRGRCINLGKQLFEFQKSRYPTTNQHILEMSSNGPPTINCQLRAIHRRHRCSEKQDRTRNIRWPALPRHTSLIRRRHHTSRALKDLRICPCHDRRIPHTTRHDGIAPQPVLGICPRRAARQAEQGVLARSVGDAGCGTAHCSCGADVDNCTFWVCFEELGQAAADEQHGPVDVDGEAAPPDGVCDFAGAG